jgi:hypothetical protein
VDNLIRKNENCIVGALTCGYVFFSQPACFIAYGYKTSPLEVGLVKTILARHHIEPIEAGDNVTPGQTVFCKKICSKIIVSRFCISFINYDEAEKELLVPNANVFMEYGLMLGLQKYVIPFQKEDHRLPFNVAGLDTIKYRADNFSDLAEKAIAKAVKDTSSEASKETPIDDVLEAFFLSNDLLVVPLNNQNEKDMASLGAPLGYVLLNDFFGVKNIFFGNFINLKIDLIVWRLRKVQEIMKARIESIGIKGRLQGLSEEQIRFSVNLCSITEFWVMVDTDETKKAVLEQTKPLGFTVRVDSIHSVMSEMTDFMVV